MKIIARLILSSALLLAGAAHAQDAWVSTGSYKPHQTQWILNWEPSKPVGDFDKYVSDWGLRGFSFEGRNFFRDNASVGLSASWNRFYQTYDNATYPLSNGTISGPVYRYADMFAVRVLLHYYLGKGNLRPYLGGGIGGSWDFAYQQTADLSKSQSNFDFIADPEIGVLYTVASGGTTVGLNAALRYTYTTATVGQIKDAQWAGVILGLAWGY